MAPISLEEVFNQVSTVTSSNINPPPGKVVLTPRSAEVCLKLGINPEILKIRDIDSFWEPGIDPAVQRIRHEAYVQRRYDIMKQCRLERKRMALAEFETATNMKAATTMTPEMLLKQQEEQSSTLIQMELQRIEKMKKRQQKELESMIQVSDFPILLFHRAGDSKRLWLCIQYEVTRAQVAAEMEKRIQAQKKKDELRKKKQEKRMRLMAEERRLRELQKAAMEEAEENRRQQLAKEMHEKEMSQAEENARKAAEAKRRARELEEEKKRKHEEHRQAVEQFFAEEQMRLRQRLESMQYAERKKQEAIMRKQEELAEAQRIKREQIEQRIEQNMNIAKMIEEKKKEDFLAKQDHFERIRQEHLRKQEEERQLKAQEQELQEQRRQMILLEQRRLDEQKAELMLRKFESEEERVAAVKEMRERENRLMKEKKDLRTQMKLENVHRVMRMNEYKRLNTEKKIEQTEDRVDKMLEQRHALLEERRKAAIQTKRQKEQLARMMEEVRTNATKASKLITQALSGKLSLDSLAATDGGSKKTKKRPQSTSKLRQMKGLGGTQSSTESYEDDEDVVLQSNQIGLGRSKSAGHKASDLPPTHPHHNNFLTETGDTAEIKYSVATGGAEPQPYVSPYALPQRA